MAPPVSVNQRAAMRVGSGGRKYFLEPCLPANVLANSLGKPEGEGALLSTSQAVVQHLPFLRRYARALTGNQGSGDAYVAATLESLIADPKILETGPNPRVALYRLFTKIWNSVP